MIPARHDVHGTLLALETIGLETVHGDFLAHVFQNLSTGNPVLVVARGDLRAPTPFPARLHSSCVTSEALGGCDCDCVEQLDAALAHIAAAGRGAVFYLVQEGRGAGLAAKARDRMLVQASRNRLTTFEAYRQMGLARDHRRYDEVAAACHLLGITAPLRLLTDNPDKVSALRDEGVAVDGVEGLMPRPSPFNRHYLAAKARAGHTFVSDVQHPATAELPEPVEAFTPHALPEAPRFIRLASYLLPIRLAAPTWFRLHAYLDTVSRRERVVLTHGRLDGAVAPLIRLQPEALLERFPVRSPTAKLRWQAALERIVADGGGCAELLLARGADPEPPSADALALLAAHVPAGRARPLLDGAGAGEVTVGAPAQLAVA